MSHVLILVTVFHSSVGIATDTASVGFASSAACEAARAALVRDMETLKGTLGREVIATCVARGT